MTFVARGAGNKTRFDLGEFGEQAGLGKPLAANYFLGKSMSTTTGNRTATGVVGSSETPIASAPITGVAVGRDTGGILWELSKVLIAVIVLLAVY